VFTEYRDSLVRIQQDCSARRIETLTLHGGMSSSERSRVQRTFNESSVTLLATDAAAEGLNLHERCRLVIHYELPWSASRLEQRAGRVDRLGQERRVHEIGLVAADTAEALVLAPLAARAARARRGANRVDGLSSTIPESRIAARILGGSADREDLGCAARAASSCSAATVHPSGLRREAADEARRLEEFRGFVMRSGCSDPSALDPIVATSIRCPARRLAAGLYAIYRITLRTRDGRVVSAGSCVLHGRAGSAGAGRMRPPALRAAATFFARPEHPQLHAGLSTAIHTALADASRVLEASAAAAGRREQAMAYVQPGAATRLIQPGLFDRRAIREADARERAGRLRREESAARSPSIGIAAVVGVEVRPIAVLHVAGRESAP
jgi:hypothetical protein